MTAGEICLDRLQHALKGPRENTALAKHKHFAGVHGGYEQRKQLWLRAVCLTCTTKLDSGSRGPFIPVLNRCAQATVILACLVDSAPLSLPTNPTTACGPAVTRAWSQQYPSCPRAILGNSVTYNTPEIDPGTPCPVLRKMLVCRERLHA